MKDYEKIMIALQGDTATRTNIEEEILTKEIYPLLSTRKAFDAPDLILNWDHKIIWIEHFSTDWSKQNKKGSIYKQYHNKQSLIKRWEQLDDNKQDIISHSINITYNDHLKNLKQNFNSHYKKIKTYKKNIQWKVPNNNTKLIFFIEIWFIYCKINGSKVWFSHDSQFISFLKDKNELSWVILNYQNIGWDTSFNKFIVIDNDNLQMYLNETYFDSSKDKIECIDILNSTIIKTPIT